MNRAPASTMPILANRCSIVNLPHSIKPASLLDHERTSGCEQQSMTADECVNAEAALAHLAGVFSRRVKTAATAIAAVLASIDVC